MSLIKSISGIRGTIGGSENEGLNPISIAKFTASYAQFIRTNCSNHKPKVVVGRDGRISGDMVKSIVVNTLVAMGIDVVDLDFSSTPTTEIAVVHEKADGGIIVTASHNPSHWNALKLLNEKGEFLSDAQGKEIISHAEDSSYKFAPVEDLGTVIQRDYSLRHAQDIVRLPQVDAEAIKAAGLKVVVDCINSVGSICIPKLLRELGVEEVILVNADLTGRFAHNPEPLESHLTQLSELVVKEGADIGFAVDPDVDRLAIVCEDGSYFGEENTLVAVADYLLSISNGSFNTVSNLSSSRALKDITLSHNGTHYYANVGEVNVTEKMKEVSALIGGEGNGGVIFPAAHYGRDALVGIALILSAMVRKSLKPTQLKALLPVYYMSKSKIVLDPHTDLDQQLSRLKSHGVFAEASITETDGIKFDFPQAWVHIRKSNTEPILRVYSEAHTQAEADSLVTQLKNAFSTNEGSSPQ